ncbi:MAG: hypothetical protein JW717_13915 [Marinilabiliaceae bacterium]|nr:hypothetical protein [Marinilabiliaceae bacterium]
MQIDIIRKKELKKFITCELFKKLTTIPISTLRAQYFIDNPKIDNEDPIIVLVRSGFETLGFAVFLPDITHDGVKFAWNSGWWIHPQKGKKIALLPLLKGIELWNEKVAFADLPENSFKILSMLGKFNFLPQQNGIKFITRPYLPKKWSNVKSFVSLANICQKISFLRQFKFRSKNIIINEIHATGLKLNLFNDGYNKGLTDRRSDDFELIESSSWLSTRFIADETPRYPFSLTTKSFSLKFFEVIENNNVIAQFCLKLRDKHLAIPYFFSIKEDNEVAFKAIINSAIKLKANSITAFRPNICEKLNNIIPSHCPRKTIFSKPALAMGLNYNNYKTTVLQDGEGDCIFT